MPCSDSMPFCAGIIHGHKPTPGVSLPLLWFDRLLRYYGALLPVPILALRAASVLLTPAAQERVANGSAAAGPAGEPAAWLWRRREFGEAVMVYMGVTVVRWWVYGLHQAGTPYAVTCNSSGRTGAPNVAGTLPRCQSGCHDVGACPGHFEVSGMCRYDTQTACAVSTRGV